MTDIDKELAFLTAVLYINIDLSRLGGSDRTRYLHTLSYMHNIYTRNIGPQGVQQIGKPASQTH